MSGSERRPPLADWRRARRDLLKSLGLGAAALPLLHATRSARAAAPSPRFICVVQSHGYRPADWKPAVGPLGGQWLPSSSAPLEPFKNRIIFLPELANQSYPAGRRGHGAYSSILYGLPGVAGAGEYRQPGGGTVDQVVGDHLAAAGGKPSTLALQAQVDLAGGSETSRRCCWRGPGAPVTPEADPVATYARLLAGPGASGAPAVAGALAERRGVLDYVGRSLERFQRRLGREDQMIIAQHLQATRDLERMLSPPSAVCGAVPVSLDALDPTQYPRVVAAQMALMLAALRCGVTQVATLQLSDPVGARIGMSFLPGFPAGPASSPGLPRTWAEVAHQGPGGRPELKRLIDKWCMERLGELLLALESGPSVEGPLLENTTVLWANTMEDGSTHDGQKVPWILAGNVMGFFRTGHCAASSGQPTSGVLAAICAAMGVPGAPFGPVFGGLRG